ncbi:hypothetical protein Pelo_6046 [Pelomyxa schiedti]|nr:hypothetical protein Pelo_6046 [Pelomyxa schiedti]
MPHVTTHSLVSAARPENLSPNRSSQRLRSGLRLLGPGCATKDRPVLGRLRVLYSDLHSTPDGLLQLIEPHLVMEPVDAAPYLRDDPVRRLLGRVVISSEIVLNSVCGDVTATADRTIADLVQFG